MRLTTLAIRNIKRNFPKYVIYVLSLSFSVFTAYSFLALIYNDHVRTAFTYDDRYQSLLYGFGTIIIIFVVFFLISSNNSFINARKKEISTYSLFGMTNGKIANLLFLETIFIGMISLIFGIATGMFFSKLMAMLLLNIALSTFTGELTFSIAPQAVYMTAMIFVATFCLMGVSGLWVINKFQLVDLFKAEKVSEGKSKGSYIILVLSVLMIGYGYYLATESNPMALFKYFLPVLLLVISGTYLFFWSGLPKVLTLIKKKKSTYFQGANLISTAAFSHRLRTISSVMATIAIMSAVATTAIAVGFTLYSNVEKNTYGTIGYDMYYYGDDEMVQEALDDVFSKHEVEITDSFSFELSRATPQIDPLVFEGYSYFSGDDSFRIYSQSDYNHLLNISRNNINPFEVNRNEALYVFPLTTIMGEENFLQGHVLSFSEQDIVITEDQGAGFISFGTFHTVVVHDDDFAMLQKSGDIIAQGDRAHVFNFERALRSPEVNRELTTILQGNVSSYRTAFSFYTETLEVFGLLCFIGFFMSAVFILMTASLLYFKQVMAAEEEKHQYKILRKVGMNKQIESNVITKRLLPVFAIPLVVGIMHSAFAMKAADTILFTQMIIEDNSYLIVLGLSGLMYALYAFVHGIFYFITRAQYKSIVK